MKEDSSQYVPEGAPQPTEKIQTGQYSRLRSLALTSLGHFVNDGTVFLVPLVADFLSFAARMPSFEIASLLVTFYGFSSLLSAFVGRLVDRSGRPGLYMALGLALLSAGLVGFFASLEYANGPYLYAIAFLSASVTGLGSAFYHPIGASILQSSFPDGSGKALGVNGAVGSLGRALYPTLFFGFAMYLTQPGSLAFFASMGLAASLAVLAGFRGGDDRKRREQPRAASSLKNALTAGILVLTFVAFARSAVTQAVIAWIPEYFSYDRSMGLSATLGVTITIMYGAGVIGQPFFGLLVERFDKRVVLALSFAGTSVSLLGYLNTGALMADFFLGCFGFFTLSGFPLFLSMSSDYVSRDSSTTGNAFVWGLGITGGAMLGPLLPSAMASGSYAQLGEAFATLALVNLALIVGLIFLPRPARSSKVPTSA